MRPKYEKNAVVKTNRDTFLDGFDYQDKPITLKFRAGAYYDIHSMTYHDNTYLDILFCDGSITPRVNRREVGLTYIGQPEIYDNRTKDEKTAWHKELEDIEEKVRKKNDKPNEVKPKTIHLNKSKEKPKDSSSGWFKK